jgi:hypothetical protein
MFYYCKKNFAVKPLQLTDYFTSITMKRIYLFTLAFFFALQLFAQIQVSKGLAISKIPGSHKKEMLEQLKNAKTYFIYPASDIDQLDELKKELSSVWTFNTLEFLSIDKIDEIKGVKGVAAFYPERMMTTEEWTGSGGTYTYYNSFIHLSLNLGEKLYTFARIETQDVMYAKVPNIGELPFAHWSIPFLKAYLFNINKELSNGASCGFQDTVKKIELKELKDGTLVIPEDVMGSDTAKELMTEYSGKFEVMPANTIQAFIKGSDKPVFIANFLITSKDKCATIYNARTGEMVYNAYTTMSREFKSKDFYRIEIAVRQAIEKG